MNAKLLAVVALVLSTSALAAETSATSTMDAAASPARSALDRAYISLFSNFHGPSTSDLSFRAVDRNGVPAKNGVNFDTDLTLAGMVTPDFGVGMVVPFIYTPVRGQDLSLGDVGLKAFDKHAIVAEGLNVYANAIVQFSTSQYSRDRGQDLALKTTPNIRYNFPGTRFTLGSWNEAKAYLGVQSGKAFKLVAQPYANYRVTRDLSLNVGYAMEWDHMKGMPGYLNFMTYQTDLQPGVVYMITPKVVFNPYLQIFTTNRVSSDSMALGATLSAQLL